MYHNSLNYRFVDGSTVHALVYLKQELAPSQQSSKFKDAL